MPEFRVAYSINTDALDALYKRLKPKGVTMSGLLAKAAGVALAKFPTLYAGLSPGLSINNCLKDMNLSLMLTASQIVGVRIACAACSCVM